MGVFENVTPNKLCEGLRKAASKRFRSRRKSDLPDEESFHKVITDEGLRTIPTVQAYHCMRYYRLSCRSNSVGKKANVGSDINVRSDLNAGFDPNVGFDANACKDIGYVTNGGKDFVFHANVVKDFVYGVDGEDEQCRIERSKPAKSFPMFVRGNYKPLPRTDSFPRVHRRLSIPNRRASLKDTASLSDFGLENSKSVVGDTMSNEIFSQVTLQFHDPIFDEKKC